MPLQRISKQTVLRVTTSSAHGHYLSFSNGDVGSDTVQFTTGQERFISQYAYEWNGYKPRQIHLRLQNAGSYAGTTFAQGVWSPDSV